MILLIDNYDSFSYNLFQLVGEVCLEQGKTLRQPDGTVMPDLKVIRNDAMTVEQVLKEAPEAIILSPGPGRPEDAGICQALVQAAAGRIPIFGVCLGHQAICQALGGKVTYAKELKHGKRSPIIRRGESRLLEGLPEHFDAARYHSLAADADSLPNTLRVTAVSPDDEVMAVEHTEYPIYGVQFHPESVMTPDGKKMIENLLIPG